MNISCYCHRQRYALCASLVLVSLTVNIWAQDGPQSSEAYELSADSKVQAGVPQGMVDGPNRWESQVFPGTVRDYWVYQPAGYDRTRPHCVLVLQDGLRKADRWKLPIVLDNLIHQKAIPPMIGVFITPGVVPAPDKQSQPRFNRSFEYDAMGPRYATFLEREILPQVAKKIPPQRRSQ